MLGGGVAEEAQSGKLKAKHLKGLFGMENQNPQGVGRASKPGEAWHSLACDGRG